MKSAFHLQSYVSDSVSIDIPESSQNHNQNGGEKGHDQRKKFPRASARVLFNHHYRIPRQNLVNDYY